MTKILGIINELACIVVFFNSVLFYLFVFGRRYSAIFERPVWEQYALRIGLLTISSGCLYSVLNFTLVPTQEIVINVGLAFLFSWAALFHYYKFVKKQP